MSTLAVDAIQNAAGTAAASIDSNGKVAFATATSGNLYQGTAVDLTGLAIKTWTGIPSWAKRIVIPVQGMNTPSGSNNIGYSTTLRVGAGGSTQSTGYVATSSYQRSSDGAQGASYDTTGFWTYYWANTNDRYGFYELLHLGGNGWVCSGNFASSESSGIVIQTQGYVGLTGSGVLDTVSVGTYNGTSTYTASNNYVNIMYQG
tara:strand:- start:1696 stop:2304 length:609 start_codon:yes stop_codon:yes gene_type:complete